MKNIRAVVVVCGLISVTLAASGFAAASSKKNGPRVASVIMVDEEVTVTTVEMDDDTGVTLTIR